MISLTKRQLPTHSRWLASTKRIAVPAKGNRLENVEVYAGSRYAEAAGLPATHGYRIARNRCSEYGYGRQQLCAASLVKRARQVTSFAACHHLRVVCPSPSSRLVPIKTPLKSRSHLQQIEPASLYLRLLTTSDQTSETFHRLFVF